MKHNDNRSYEIGSSCGNLHSTVQTYVVKLQQGIELMSFP